MKRLLYSLIIVFCLVGCKKKHELISVFPLEKYDQQTSAWIKPTDHDYEKAQINSDTARQRLAIFYRHYIGASSPWNQQYVSRILQAPKPDDLAATEKALIKQYDNQNKPEKAIGYGENFHAYSPAWINDIAANVHLAQFENLHYNADNRAIAIDNLPARALPTNDVFFFHHKIAGQGYPFDNLQMSSLWVGTPLYILGVSQDRAWSLVITPDFIAWVKSSGIARVSKAFASRWEKAAVKHLVAITQTKTSLVDTNHVYRFIAYVGAVFPGEETKRGIKLMIPTVNAQQQAVITYAMLPKQAATLIPLASTPHNFSRIMGTLLGRPYGWGNMYFYNDCSAELKSLFTPFGIWLPRHSSDQMFQGKLTDLAAESEKNRLDYLMVHGRRFTTLIYVGGHVMLFIGNYPNPNDPSKTLMPMTFQNMWGLSPKPPKRRMVVGQSVLFPLLEHYPEDPSLASQASKKHFQISLLDEPSNNLQELEIIDLKNLMYP